MMQRYLPSAALLAICLAISAGASAERKNTHSDKIVAGTIPGGSVVVVTPATTAGPFIHPGVLVNRAQLDEIKRRVAAGVEPQKSAFAKLKADPLGRSTTSPTRGRRSNAARSPSPTSAASTSRPTARRPTPRPCCGTSRATRPTPRTRSAS